MSHVNENFDFERSNMNADRIGMICLDKHGKPIKDVFILESNDKVFTYIQRNIHQKIIVKETVYSTEKNTMRLDRYSMDALAKVMYF